MAEPQGVGPGGCRAPAPRAPSLSDLPDEILLQMFTHLSDLGPPQDGPGDPTWQSKLPYHHADADDQPHPGLRAYPFLGQVCKRWNRLLNTSIAQSMLWHSLVVDFGHELVTAIHTPLKWSNRRPSSEEFSNALNATTLSVIKILDFIRNRKQIIRSLCLCNSEGFWGDEGEYLTLSNKHNFQASHLGYVLALLQDSLEELQLFSCNDLLNVDMGVWTLVPMCSNLHTLAIEGINNRVPAHTVAQLSQLTKLRSLTITGEEHMGQWITGLDGLPGAWTALTALSSLTLRGHQLLDTLPSWLAALPSLVSLDVSNNASLSISNITTFTRLSTLSLQSLDLSQAHVPGDQLSMQAKRILPDLTPLAKSLTCLSLAQNCLTRFPAFLPKLTALRILDLNGNRELTVPTPLTSVFSALASISIIDCRGVHREKSDTWSVDKCATMGALANAAKLLKRRSYHTQFLFDRDS